MKTVQPNPKAFAELISGQVNDEPIVMVNLLKFKEEADYASLGSSHKDSALKLSGTLR